MLFHEKLIQRRREKGMTQEDLAERLSVSRQTVSKWENGECMPDADKFIRLSDILEISLDELAGREVEVEPIVLPAPELPKPGGKLRRLLAAAAACLIFVLGGFALGRYVFPKTAPAAENPQPAALPETLSCSGFTVAGGKASFTANAAIDGKVYLYRSDLPDQKPISLDELAGREVEVEPIVVPAPELPKPGRKLRRLPAAAAACLLFVLAGFALGRYVFPKTVPAAGNTLPAAGNMQPAALPETLRCSGFAVAGGKASFTANAAVDGKVCLYRSDFADQMPISRPAVYRNGVYTVDNLPVGQYQKMVLVLSAGGLERSALVVTNLEIGADGSAGWSNE